MIATNAKAVSISTLSASLQNTSETVNLFVNQGLASEGGTGVRVVDQYSTTLLAMDVVRAMQNN